MENRAMFLYVEMTGNKPPDDVRSYHEWYKEYVKWLENFVKNEYIKIRKKKEV